MKKSKEAARDKKIRISETLTEEEFLEDARRNSAPDPVVSLIKSYLLDEIPYPEDEFADIEFKIKARKVISDGKSAKCPKFETDSLASCTDLLWDRFGGGFYHLFISYRRMDLESPQKYSFIKVADVPIVADGPSEMGDAPEALVEEEYEAPMRERLAAPTQNDFLTQMLLKSQDAMQAVMLELVRSRSEVPQTAMAANPTDILDAFQRGADMVSDLRDSGNAPSLGSDPDSIPAKIREWLPLVNIAKEVLGKSAPAPVVDGNGNLPLKKLKEVLMKPENAAALKELSEGPETAEMTKLLMNIQ